MSRAAVVYATKDFRALLPVWACSVVTMLAAPLLHRTPLGSIPLGMSAYVLGALALGAHSIGHEYTNRTLAALLAQPWKRSSLLATKAAVLFAMLLVLASIAWPATARDAMGLSAFGRRWQLVLPFLGGLLVAPSLTMKLRSQIAGAVFTASIPGTVWLAALLAGIARYGVETGAANEFAFRVWPPCMVLCAIGGAWLSVRSFLRLEASEGAGGELRLPHWISAMDRNPIRPPLWTLAKKELRLQQMTFAMAALFGLIWIAVTAAARVNPEFAADFPVRAVGLLYFALLPLLVGSLGSAQERQFGTLESQAMLPVSFTRQWLVKAGIVLALAVVLGVLVPWFVFAPRQAPYSMFWSLGATVTLLTAWSLYISSWCASGITALSWILPATAAAIVWFRSVDDALWTMLRGASSLRDGVVHLPAASANALFAGIVAATIGVLVYFAGMNHRRTERRRATLAWQAGALLVLLTAVDLVSVLFLS